VFQRGLRSVPLVVVALALALALFAPASAVGQPRDGLDPSNLVIHDGPGGRYLMGGEWLFRRDTPDEGEIDRFFNQKGRGGWSPITIPNAWNAQDESPDSMNGDIVWYRKDFRLPSDSSALTWIVRFQNVRYHTRVWLNGKEIGTHTGAYLPWELKLSGLTKGVNRLVLRVDNRRFDDDLPPAQFDEADGTAGGGWWNYGGMLGEAYLRKVNKIDMQEVEVRPTLPNGPAASAQVAWRIKLRNYSARAQRVRVTGNYGTQKVNLGTRRIGAGATAEARGRMTVKNPRLWSPPDPELYDVTITADAGDVAIARKKAAPLRRVGDYVLRSGIRSLQVVNGRLLLNGEPMNARGVFVHEDDFVKGSALGNAEREKIINEARDLGATLMRTHYPMHPEMHELADRLGVLIWSEIPVFQVPDELLKRSDLRAVARDMLRTNVLTNQNHPSVVTWSVSNELRPEPSSIERSYYREASTLLRSLDPTRPISTVIAGYLDHTQQSAYDHFDMLGFNSYFGWYPGRQASIADRDNLSPFLDKMRALYPKQAIMITEHGAEANREGPEEERGTYAFQSDFYNFHNSVYATKPWLSGVIGTLRSFRVRPGWEGGNPKPTTNWHEKGVIDFFDNKKPAFGVLQNWFRNTVQYGPGTPR
jgi:beta-glucuronidase